jgi:periplasmic protein TonB
MIRRSTAIATAAIVLSVLVHILGLSFTSSTQPTQPAEDAASDVVAMGNAFEDVAEAVSEPVPPEHATVSDPPVETPIEPDIAETPTSEVLVASANPQRVFAPDSGSVKASQRETTGPIEPEGSSTPKPKDVQPSGVDEETVAAADPTRPIEPSSVAKASERNPDERTKPVEAGVGEMLTSPPLAPVPQQPAAMPAQAAPSPPITPAHEPSAIPVIPLEQEAADPETPVEVVEYAPGNHENADTENETNASKSAVVASLRPRLLERTPTAEPQGVRDGSTDLQFPPSQLVESPLTVYQRDGVDLIARGNSGAQSGGLGFRDSRGPGNSDVTNYAGRVLMHLNRAPVVHVSAQGFARVFFEINPDGTLAWVDIIDGTGSQEIDRAAKAQVRIAAPFPRPPQGVSRKLSFVYRIN